MEVVSRQGSCILPEGHLPQLETGRTGHVSILAANLKTVFTCGGRDSTGTGLVDRRCWKFSPGGGSSSKWVEVPGLREPVSYASGAYHGGKVWVLGGKDEMGSKSKKVQVG